jgi:hypothetical protein
MAAGAGYIEFATGDILTATAANQYLASQVVMVFASSSARTSAIASPQEGMVSYLKDTNSVEYYSGSAWAPVAGASGSMTLLSTTTLSGSATAITISDASYKNLYIELNDFNMSASNHFGFRINNVSSSQSHIWSAPYAKAGAGAGTNGNSDTYTYMSYYYLGSGDANNFGWIQINDYNNSMYRTGTYGSTYNGEGAMTIQGGTWGCNDKNPVTRVDIVAGSGSWSGGTVKVYGVK